jgi:polyhydroxyalkanoate synthesis regulator protein
MTTRKFVKYRNRKLHEEGSEESYVSMAGLGDIVASGADVVVEDDRTGEDLTVMTLARILYDRCREGYTVKAAALKEILVDARKPKASKAA